MDYMSIFNDYQVSEDVVMYDDLGAVCYSESMDIDDDWDIRIRIIEKRRRDYYYMDMDNFNYKKRAVCSM